MSTEGKCKFSCSFIGMSTIFLQDLLSRIRTEAFELVIETLLLRHKTLEVGADADLQRDEQLVEGEVRLHGEQDPEGEAAEEGQEVKERKLPDQLRELLGAGKIPSGVFFLLRLKSTTRKGPAGDH